MQITMLLGAGSSSGKVINSAIMPTIEREREEADSSCARNYVYLTKIDNNYTIKTCITSNVIARCRIELRQSFSGSVLYVNNSVLFFFLAYPC